MQTEGGEKGARWKIGLFMWWLGGVRGRGSESGRVSRVKGGGWSEEASGDGRGGKEAEGWRRVKKDGWKEGGGWR